MKEKKKKKQNGFGLKFIKSNVYKPDTKPIRSNLT